MSLGDFPPKRLRFSKAELAQERTWTPRPKVRPVEPLSPATPSTLRRDDELPMTSDWMD